MMFVMGVGLYTSRVILKTLGVEDFGIYNVVGGIVALFGFLNSSLTQGTQRFLTFCLGQNNQLELKNIFSASLLLHFVLSILVLILAETIGLWFLENKLVIPVERRHAAFWVYQFSIFASMISIIQVPYNASIIAHERMNIYAYVSIFEAGFKLGIVYLLLVSGYDKLISYAFLTLIVQFTTIIIYQLYCGKQFSECHFRGVANKAVYKSLLHFSGWLIMPVGVQVISLQGINFLLNIFFNPAMNAARAISMQVNSAVTVFVNNFQIAVNPNIIKLYASGNKEEWFSLIFQNTKYSFCLMWILMLPIILKIDFLLNLWLIDIPEYTSIFCRIILLQSLILCMERPFSTAIQATGNIKSICILVSIMHIMVLPVSYYSLKFGMPAYMPFGISVFAVFLEFIYHLYFLCKQVMLSAFQFFRSVIFPLLLVVICSLSVSLIANYYFSNNFFSFIAVCLTSLISSLIPIYYFVFSKFLKIKIVNKILRR
jgi:O-antigen/teichoic acid export membrane protein